MGRAGNCRAERRREDTFPGQRNGACGKEEKTERVKKSEKNKEVVFFFLRGRGKKRRSSLQVEQRGWKAGGLGVGLEVGSGGGRCA